MWTLWRWWLFKWASDTVVRARVTALWPLGAVVLLAVVAAVA